MGSIHKHQKLNEEVDRLSNLPEGLISRILSFLPTKWAVRTTILSSKWKHQWRSITNLDFDDCLHSLAQSSKSIIQMSFTNFVYRVLLLCKISHLHKFHLKCDRDYPVSHINAWVSAALSHDVQEIDINIRISRKKIGLLPCDLFTCQTLVVLKLSVHVLEVPTSVCLPNLKVLRLKGTEIKDDASFSRLLSSCPSLEDLALLACVSDNMTGLNISAPTLKKLVLDRFRGSVETKFNFVLDAPQLVYLEFAGYVPGEGSTLKNLHSLVEARINFYWGACSSNSIIKEIKESATEFAQGLSNVQFLYMSTNFSEMIPFKVFSDLKSKYPLFLKLRKLEVGIHGVCGCSLLQDLLESSPHLETLVLKFVHYVPLENNPVGIWNRLKIVELSPFVGSTSDLRFVKYILKNAKVLERLHLEDDFMSTKEHLNATKKLLSFRRASSSCKLKL